MIVADANIVTYLLVEGPFSKPARSVYTRDPDWRVPVLWRSEFCNALVVLVRAGQLEQTEGRLTLQRGLALMHRGELDVSTGEAYRLAMKLRISAYDAHYVALAEALGVPCVTEDRLLLERAPRHTVALSQIARDS